MSDKATPPAASAPLPPIAFAPPMPAPKVFERPEPILSKFHLTDREQQILNLANETNQSLQRVFSDIARVLQNTKPKLDALTPDERKTWAAIDGTPPDDAIAAIAKLSAVLDAFKK